MSDSIRYPYPAQRWSLEILRGAGVLKLILKVDIMSTMT